MKKKFYRRWLLMSPIGLSLTGMGLCMSIDAGFNRYIGEPWILYGTAALVVFNAGLSIIGGAIINRVRYHQTTE